MSQTHETKLGAAMQQFEDLEADVLQAALNGDPIDEVERSTWHQLLAIGLNLIHGFVLAQGDGDMGETFELDDGRTVKRLPEPHERRYVSIFGEFPISRRVYGTRETQKIQAQSASDDKDRQAKMVEAMAKEERERERIAGDFFLRAKELELKYGTKIDELEMKRFLGVLNATVQREAQMQSRDEG